MNYYFLFFILMKKIIYLNCYIVLPVETLKKENYISPYTPNSPKDIIYCEYCNPIITELEIGTPPQKIPFLIQMKTNDFVVTSINPMNKNASEYYINKTLYNFSSNFFKNILSLMKISQILFLLIFVKIEEKNIINMMMNGQ